jgi:hypothetical protein
VLIWRRRKNTPIDQAGQETVKQEFAAQEQTAEIHGSNGTGRHELMAQPEYVELPAREVRYELQ